MKRLLLYFFFLALTSWYAGVHAQTSACDVKDLVIANVRLTGTTSTTCTYTFDAAFTINAQTRFVYFQSYLETAPGVTNPSPYPDYWDCANGTTSQTGRLDPPTRNTNPTIGNPILNIAIDNSGNEPVLVAYLPDPGVPTTGVVAGSSGITKVDLANNDTRFNLTGLQITLPTELCSQPFVLVSDFFASVSNQPTNIQCVNCSVRFAVNFLNIVQPTGLVCGTSTSPSVFLATLQNSTSNALTANYQLFVDVDNNRIITPGVDTPVPGASGTITIGANSTNFVASNNVPASATGLILVTTLTSGGFGVGAVTATFIGVPECIVLPVKFKSFTASRKAQNVLLQWETAMEDNNKGFYVQRNAGGSWSNVAFVPSKAEGGNSSSVLAYQFTDANTEKGVTQYRLQQEDIDGRAKLSEIRSVRGLEQAAKTIIYPNPSNGNLTIVFDDASGKDVFITDISGRVLKQWNGVTNNLQVSNLVSGMYTVRIVDLQTGTQTSEKIVVNKK